MRKFFILYKFNLINIFYNRKILINIASFLIFTILMDIIFIVSASLDYPGDKLVQSDSYDSLTTIRRWFLFVGSLIIIFISLQMGLLLGKNEVENDLTKLELRSGFKAREIFLFKHFCFMTVLFFIFIPIILINVILYTSSENFVNHYYFYQFFFSSLLWFFICIIISYAIFFTLFLFFSKILISALVSILFVVFFYLNAFLEDTISEIFTQERSDDDQNLKSYEYYCFDKALQSDKELYDFLKDFVLNSKYDLTIRNDEINMIYQLCTNETNSVVAKYNNMLKDGIGDYTIDVRVDPNSNLNLYSEYGNCFDGLISKIKNKNQEVIKGFLQIGRMNEVKPSFSVSIIPFFFVPPYNGQQDYLDYKAVQVAFWSLALLTVNGSSAGEMGNSYTTSSIETSNKNNFYKSQEIQYILDPILQFNVMMNGAYYKNDVNYIYLTNFLLRGNCLNYKFINKNNKVTNIKYIVNPFLIYLEYFIIGILILWLSYIKYKKELIK